MNRTGINLAPGEYVVADIRRHGVGLTGVAIRLVLVAGSAGYLMGAVELWFGQNRGIVGALRWLILAMVLIFVLMLAFGRFRRWSRMQTLVTNTRVTIRYRRGRPTWEIPFASVVEARAKNGLLQRPFRVGTILIRTNFAPQLAEIPDVARVHEVLADLLATRDQAWAAYYRDRGLADGTGPMQAIA